MKDKPYSQIDDLIDYLKECNKLGKVKIGYLIFKEGLFDNRKFVGKYDRTFTFLSVQKFFDGNDNCNVLYIYPLSKKNKSYSVKRKINQHELEECGLFENYYI